MYRENTGVWNLYRRRTAGIMGAILMFWGIGQLLNEMYVSEGGRHRVLWHHFYEDAGRIDNLF